jgi:hypothetical protein
VDPAFTSGEEYWEHLSLSPGEHQINYFDSYGDGWHGGYWSVLPGTVTSSVGVVPIAGGSGAGAVTGYGGDTAFTLVSGEDGTVTGTASAEAGVVVHIHTTIFANEITWSIDGGSSFGPFANYGDYDEEMQLSQGSHVLSAFDSYGDGWHGGYWEVINDCGDITAGGPPTATSGGPGVINGYGGEFPIEISEATVACTDNFNATEPSGCDQQLLTVAVHAGTFAIDITWQVFHALVLTTSHRNAASTQLAPSTVARWD